MIYNLLARWVVVDAQPGEVWAEMDRREVISGMTETLPKTDAPGH